MRVPEYRRQIADVVPSTRIKADVPDLAADTYKVEAAGAKALGEGLNALRLGLEVRQEKQDQYQLASAVNEFRRANTEYLHARDGGVFSKKGGQTFGISEQYDQYAQTTMDDIARRYKMNDRVRESFIGATNALRDSSLSSVMRYEQRETDAARELEWKTMADETLSNAALCYNDDAAFDEELNIGLGAVAQQFAPYGDEVVGRKLKEFASKCQTSRVAAMLEDDPRAAEAYLKKYKSEFIGADFLRVKKAVDDRMDVLRVQETTDGLVRRFGSEAAALAHVRKHYEGDMENKLVAAVKTRFGEMRAAQGAAQVALAERQEGNFQTLVAEYIDKGLPVPDQMLNDLKRTKGLNAAGAGWLAQTGKQMRTRTFQEGEYYASLPENVAPSEADREAFVRSRLGVTEDDARRGAETLYDQLLRGDLDEKTVAAFYAGGVIDRNARDEVARLRDFYGKQNPRTQEAVAKYLEAKVAAESSFGVSPLAVKTEYAAAMAEINPKAADFQEQAFRIADEVLRRHLVAEPRKGFLMFDSNDESRNQAIEKIREELGALADDYRAAVPKIRYRPGKEPRNNVMEVIETENR